MSDDQTMPERDEVEVPAAEAKPQAPGRGAKLGGLALLLMIAGSLLWYLLADRYTPYTSQARVQAFVVPVAAEVPGRIVRVFVQNNDVVSKGQPLFEVDRSQFDIALQKAEADFESAKRGVGAGSAAIVAAQAGVRAARANLVKAEKDARRQEKLYAEDPGAISVRRLEVAQASEAAARAQVDAAEAQVQQAIEQQGGPAEQNAKLLAASQAVEKAKLDLSRTRVLSPGSGVVTDLKTDSGQFAAAGSPMMTLIAVRDVWISADLTENNLGHIRPGNEVAIVLDAMPGEVLRGRVRSVGNGVASGKSTQGGLPQVDNSRDWLRQAQRFPVAIEFDTAELNRLRDHARIGGQADVAIYTGDHPLLNALSRTFVRLMSWVSYVY
ncbi:HlyD family secretion protein [Chitinibacteraceae bacterium HSL-7]